MVCFHVKTVHVVEPAIGGLSYNRAGPSLIDRVVLCLPVNDGVAHNANGMCIGDSNGTFQHATLFHPGCAGHLTVAVKGKRAREYRFIILLPAWVDDRDSRPCRIALDNGGIPNGHALDVCNGITFTCAAIEWNP